MLLLSCCVWGGVGWGWGGEGVLDVHALKRSSPWQEGSWVLECDFCSLPTSQMARDDLRATTWSFGRC